MFGQAIRWASAQYNAGMDIQAVAARLNQFAEDRDWDQYHNPKNLAMAIAGETGELLEVFQWLTPDQAANLTTAQRDAAKDEVADILIYVIRLADKLDIDIDEAVTSKINTNIVRFPPDAVQDVASKQHGDK